MEGVAQDQGTPGSPAVDAKGTPVGKMPRFTIEVDVEDAHRQAVFQRVIGNNDLADRLDAIAGKKSTAGFIQKNPKTFGVAVGVLGTLAVGGATYGIVKLVKRRRLAKMGGAKVIRMR